MSSLPRHIDPRSSAVSRYRRTSALAYVIVIISLLATLLMWHIDRKQAFERTRVSFEHEIDRTRSAILSRLKVYEDGLYGTRSLFEANPNVTRTMFREYVSNLNLAQRFPGLQGIGYAIQLKPSEVRAHVRAVRNEGFPEYSITPQGDREVYTSILYIYPFDWRNQRAFGYDMFSEPVRRRAMEIARDTGRTSVTAKVRLVQEVETDVQPGFLMYLALYRKGAPLNSVEDRRNALIGYVYSPFRVGTLMHEVVQQGPPLATLRMFAGPEPEPDSLLYESPGDNDLENPAFTELSHFEFGARPWTLKFISTPEFTRTVEQNSNRFILPAGVLISLLLFAITVSIAQTQKRAIRLADNITARLKESERSILSMNEQLTEALYRSEKLAITGRLVATVAHEINNPLEALTNLLYVLKNATPDRPEWRAFVQQAEDQVAVLTNISRQTLAPYRLAAFPVSTNISELLDDVLSAFRPRLMSSRVRVHRDYPPSVEATIYASELRQVFTNLIGNAIDAMSDGGNLKLSVSERGSAIVILVSDDGVGIPAETLSRIFEPFYTTKAEKGSGVGLWVVKTILEKLGGNIEVHSCSDRNHHGTTFTVTVPNAVQSRIPGSS